MPQTLWCDLCTTFNRSRTNSHGEHHKRMGTRQSTSIFTLVGPGHKHFHFNTAESERLKMFIAIIGTRYSGKTTVKDYLVSKGFKSVSLTDEGIDKVCTLSLPIRLLCNGRAVVCQTSSETTASQTSVVRWNTTSG